jgi:signal transduction histidine kinase
MTEKPQGTGLGLPISRQIIEHFGGRLWVKSEPGKGATFAFALPVSKQEGQDTAVEPARPRQEGATNDQAARASAQEE